MTLTERIHTLQSMRGALEKAEFIKANAQNDEFRLFLFYALNPLLTYKVSEQTLTKEVQYDPAVTLTMTDIFTVCETLSRRKAVDDATLYQVTAFLSLVPTEERELYIKLLAKTIRLGVTAKTVNKLIPDLIPEWEVQQAYQIDRYPIPNGTWFALTQKLNGVRATYYKGQLIARSGVPYTGLDHITNEFAPNGVDDMVFDGELTLANNGALSDNEAFRAATGIINSDNVDKTRICYTVFDMLPVSEFEHGASKDGYKKRRMYMQDISAKFNTDGPVRFLPVLYAGTDQSTIPQLLDLMVRQDKEGLMANLDVPYLRKRHNGILKIKRFYTMDLPILSCEEGTGRLTGVLGAFVLDYKGSEVRVGSGFTDEQRSDYWQRRSSLPGALCEVKYKEISSDKHTGAQSLQFPVFVGLRTDKTSVSYG